MNSNAKLKGSWLADVTIFAVEFSLITDIRIAKNRGLYPEKSATITTFFTTSIHKEDYTFAEKTRHMKRIFLSGMLCLASAYVLAQTAEDFKQPFPLGQKISPHPNFTGEVWLAPLSHNKLLNVPMNNVTFAPSCRNNWHKHVEGQILIATSGVGYYQERGKVARRLLVGDIVEVPAHAEHWHGAAPDSWFAHIAITCNPQTNRTTWLEVVDDKHYKSAVNESMSGSLFQAKKVLSARQIAIILVASNTAVGNLYRLKTSLSLALEAGMTVNEVREILVQAYAYCGFPRSLRAIQTFITLLDERKNQGITDIVGREASPITDNRSKYERGAEILSQLTGTPTDAPKTGYAVFAPIIEQFLKEHLFADIFERNLLTYSERELVTVSMLTSLGGVEPMARSHMRISLHLGTTLAQLEALLQVVTTEVEQSKTEPIQQILIELTKE